MVILFVNCLLSVGYSQPFGAAFGPRFRVQSTISSRRLPHHPFLLLEWLPLRRHSTRRERSLLWSIGGTATDIQSFIKEPAEVADPGLQALEYESVALQCKVLGQPVGLQDSEYHLYIDFPCSLSRSALLEDCDIPGRCYLEGLITQVDDGPPFG